MRTRTVPTALLLVVGFSVTPRAIDIPYLTVSLTPSQTVTVKNVGTLDVDTLCVVYTSLDEVLNGAPYAPRHCIAFDPGQLSSYVDDWDFIPNGHTYDVQAELYFPHRDEPVRTNTVRVVRK